MSKKHKTTLTLLDRINKSAAEFDKWPKAKQEYTLRDAQQPACPERRCIDAQIAYQNSEEYRDRNL